MLHKSSTLEILIEKLFDYSGMFPPEAKSFEAALADAARFPQSLTRPWLVHTDFVIMFNELRKVTTDTLKRSGFSEERRFRCAVLGASFSGEIAPVLPEVKELLEFNRANSENTPRISVTSYEVRLSGGVSPSSLLIEYLAPLSKEGVAVYLEPDLSTDSWEDLLNSTIEAIVPERDWLGLKFRGTGPTAIGNRKIASVLILGARHELHLKATGGMHHPVLESRYQNTLGFVNIAAALALLRGGNAALSYDQILHCLNETNAEKFQFGEELRWGPASISKEELQGIAARLRFSIGSCSLREPDEDLVRLYGAPS